MAYTDRHGRPEIIADPGLKRDPAAYRIDIAAAAAADGPADGDADGPGTGGTDLSLSYCEHAC